jgi:glucose-1-phosphate thymidylyltransferase
LLAPSCPRRLSEAFNPSFCEVHPKLKPIWRNEMEITDAISLLIDSGFKVVPHHVEGWWRDTGKLECALAENRLTLDGNRDLRQ